MVRVAKKMDEKWWASISYLLDAITQNHSALYFKEIFDTCIQWLMLLKGKETRHLTRKFWIKMWKG